jgi:hypothetical protein
MRGFKFAPVAVLALVFTSCTVQSHNEGVQQGSSLTSIDVNLPAKDQLPKGLQGENLVYCFSVIEGMIPVNETAPHCMTPYNTKDTFRKGPYTGAIKLDAKLDSSKQYQVTLVIGYSGGDSSGTVTPVTTLTAPSSITALSEANTSESDEINLSRINYRGDRAITPAEMKGKAKLQISLDLVKYGTDSSDQNDMNPDSISTGNELDLEIVPVFKENDPIGTPVSE